MGIFVALLYSLAVVAVALGGVATIAGLGPLRERCFTAAALLLLAAVMLPLVARALEKMMTVSSADMVNNGDGQGVAVVAAVVVGHGALAAALSRRRRQQAGGAGDLEQARGRGRPRLSPEGREE